MRTVIKKLPRLPSDTENWYEIRFNKSIWQVSQSVLCNLQELGERIESKTITNDT